MAVSVKNVTVRSFTLAFLDISWEVDPTPDNLADFRFVVERSENPDGDYEAVSPPLQDVFTFRDRKVDQKAKWRKFFYRIRTKHVPGTLPDHVSLFNSQDAPPDLVALAIMRRWELLLKVSIGRLVAVFKRRSFGQNCPECFDEIRDRKSDPKCKTCLGSLYVGGYFKPIATHINFTPHYKTIRLTPIHEIQPSETVVELSGYPPLKANDMIVEQENLRWRVQDVRERSKKRFVFRQICRLMAIPRSEIEWEVPVGDSAFVLPGDEIILFDRVKRGGVNY